MGDLRGLRKWRRTVRKLISKKLLESIPGLFSVSCESWKKFSFEFGWLSNTNTVEHDGPRAKEFDRGLDVE